MTVRYLQSIHHKPQPLNDSTIVNKYKAGFGECAQQITRYVQKSDGMKQEMKQRLISYLSHCLQSLDSASSHFKPFTSSNIGSNNLINSESFNFLNNNSTSSNRNNLSIELQSFFQILSNNSFPITDMNNNLDQKLSFPSSPTNSSLLTFTFPIFSNTNNSSQLSPHQPSEISFISESQPLSINTFSNIEKEIYSPFSKPQSLKCSLRYADSISPGSNSDRSLSPYNDMNDLTIFHSSIKPDAINFSRSVSAVWRPW